MPWAKPKGNPHHTGEWLKSNHGTFTTASLARFNPHHTGEWLKEVQRVDWVLWVACFNPHHTGEWLESQTHLFNSARKCLVSILIILANGWKELWRKLRPKRKPSFNPHHTGEWLERISFRYSTTATRSFQSSSYWRMAEKTSALSYHKEYGDTCFNPHHTGEWLKSEDRNKNGGALRLRFNPHHTGEWLKSWRSLNLVYIM